MKIQVEISEDMYHHLSGEADFQGKTKDQYLVDLYNQHILEPSNYFEAVRKDVTGIEQYTSFVENMRMYINEAIAQTTNSGYHTDDAMRRVFELLREKHIMLGYTLMELHKAYFAHSSKSLDKDS